VALAMSVARRLRWIVGIVLLLAVYPIIQEFFIELAREQGAYQEPTKRVRGVMTFLSDLAQDWRYQLAVAFLAGVFLGTILDWLARRIDRRRATPAQPEPPWAELGMAAISVAARIRRFFVECDFTERHEPILADMYALLLRLRDAGITLPPVTYDLEPEGGAERAEKAFNGLLDYASYLAKIGPLLRDG
jgi:hypothetical protein